MGKTGRNLIILILCVFVALGAYKFTMSSSAPDSEAAKNAAMALKETGEDMPATGETSEEQTAKEKAEAVKAAMEAADEGITVNVAAVLAKRALGDPEAPVTVYDFSSLTCPHCARFHNDIFPQIKENYIDTGKVYWVAHDFPLDRKAMQATIMARCAPVDAYFVIVDQLFATQEDWVMSENTPVKLAQIGADSGLSPELLEACLNHEALQDELFKRMKKLGQKWQISATPSFVLNDGAETVTGELAYEKFARKIDALIKSTP